MQAMILAAGLGSRMQPLTHFIPKPLFPVLNTPSIERILRSLIESGFSHIYINLFHLAQCILSVLHDWTHASSINIIPVVEPFLLGTGGALVNASPYFLKDSPLILVNADVVCDIDFRRFWEDHVASGAVATLLVHNKTPYNNLDVSNGLLVGFESKRADALAYTGIACFSPAFFHFLPSEMPCSLIDGLKNALARGVAIRAMSLTDFSKNDIWEDIGTLEGYLAAHRQLLVSDGRLFYRGDGCRLALGVRLEEWVCLGNEVVVEENTIIRRSVVWSGSHIPPNELIEDSVVSKFGILKWKPSN